MKTVSMSGSLREGVGKKDAKLQRSEGKIPCVLYGGKEQYKFVVDEKSFHQIVFSPDSFFIKLELDGKIFDCILKDIQYHPVSDTILHADFIEFDKDHPITMSVPVKFTGNAPGIIKGGQLVKKFRKLNVRALPKDMPESLVVDISELDIDQKVTIAELKQEKYKILENQDRYIIAIRATRASATGEPGAEGAAPAK
jgi:large subunit ribosomal protein L25